MPAVPVYLAAPALPAAWGALRGAVSLRASVSVEPACVYCGTNCTDFPLP